MKKIILILAAAVGLLSGCGGPKTHLIDDPRVLFDQGMADFQIGKYSSAVEKFQRLVYNFPGAIFVDSAQFFLAQSYYGNEEYILASVEYNRLVSNYPQSELYDDAQYMTGLCYFKGTPKHYGLDQEDLKLAVAAMNNFILDNPDSDLIPDAQKIILEARTKLARKDYESGVLYIKMYDLNAARIYFQLVIDEYTDTPYAGMALYRLAEIDYKEKDYQMASDRLNQFLNIYENSELAGKARKLLEEITLKTLKAQASDDEP